ncbi:molybdopterin-dependent oxidoreductase [Arthrobacter sp. AQ5-05]|uniref:molybdopterin-dependent oxidoreductase n=1 Tax=Arthrobacter sp. AQ5-05 TaxID=2184581 RepID=UPI0015EC7A73|nr:molybdopterin-dependent oxidoreductase [Arthrobacter sp. AQ5-05]
MPGRRHLIGLARWWHLGVDTLWLANGIVFHLLLSTSGRRLRLVPTSWEAFPNAVSVAVQYLSLDWPTDHAWTGDNFLQMLAYFVTVFIAAPPDLLTGLGMYPALSTKFRWISRFFSIQVARSLPFLVPGVVPGVHRDARVAGHRHRCAAQPEHDVGQQGRAARVGRLPDLRALAGCHDGVLGGGHPVQPPAPAGGPAGGLRAQRARQRLFEHLDSKPGRYTEKDISPYLWHNGKYPVGEDHQQLSDGNLAEYRLQISGLVVNPVARSLQELRALEHHEQITQHFCIQGWSGVAKGGGVSIGTVLDSARPDPKAKWVIFYLFAEVRTAGSTTPCNPSSRCATNSRCRPTT